MNNFKELKNYLVIFIVTPIDFFSLCKITELTIVFKKVWKNIIANNKNIDFQKSSKIRRLENENASYLSRMSFIDINRFKESVVKMFLIYLDLVYF